VVEDESKEEPEEPLRIEVPEPEPTPQKERRPANRLKRLAHSQAHTFFRDEQDSYMTQVHEDKTNTEDHDYPFFGTKHLNPIGVNEHPVRMSNRTRNDFDKVNKLNPSKVPPSKTGYEAYTTGNEKRAKTKGLFQNDPQRIGVVKTPAEYQVTDFKDLVSRNQQIRDHMSR
jgi:hypothetical protein